MHAQPLRGKLGILLLLSFIGIGFNLLKPWPLKIIVDHALPGRALTGWLGWLSTLPGADTRHGLLSWMTALEIVLFLIGWVITVFANHLRLEISGRLKYDLSAEVFTHLQRMSLRFHNNWPTGDLVKRVAVDCGCISGLIFDVCFPAATALATLVAVFVILWQSNPTLALLSLATAPPLAVLIKIFSKPMMDRQYEQAELQGEMMTQAEHALTAIPVIQTFHREGAEGRQFEAITSKVGDSYMRCTFADLRFSVAVKVTIALGTTMLMAVGGNYVLDQRIQVGDLLIFLSYLTFLYTPLETIAFLSMSNAQAAAGARRVFELMESGDWVHEDPEALNVPAKPAGKGIAVRFENVSFGYEKGTEVLHQVNINVAPGQTVALVGPTGAGKTTLTSLMLRLFDPSEGRITFDGVDIRRYRLDSLRESMAIVLQDPFLLPMTVAENIAYARPHASRDEVVAAAGLAHAAEFIDQLPEGYDTVLGERGATLSGGQRQRLAIARAFLKDAPILILDEPTSALDTQTEASLMEATSRLMKGRTTFIIGHRLSTVKYADLIVVLRSGGVVEMGTHSSLVEAQGLYHSLYSVQFQNPSK